ncbi:MAG: hypothetical protein QHH07_01165 [Sedimentisphaerales bacterium]|jgi:hypothetical protein|nr:hypothetical protein [Sedimentisphaerales bacterium]
MDPISLLRSIGPVDRLPCGDLSRPIQGMAVNTHVHLAPNFSAFASVKQALDLARQQGVLVLGAGNYYDYTIYKTFAQAAVEDGVFPLFCTEIIAMQPNLRDAGIRVNDPANPGKTYVCGKGITRFDQMTQKASQILGLIRANDASRMAKMVDALTAFFDAHGLKTGLDPDTIIEMISERYSCPQQTVVLQERHVALAFQVRIFELLPPGKRARVLSPVLGIQDQRLEEPLFVQDQIRTRLMKVGRPCFVPEAYVGLDQARQLIWELGGIDCYPVVADMVPGGCEFEVPAVQLAERLWQMGFRMVEFISVRNSPEALKEYVITLRRQGLAVANGTEHNTTELIPLRPTCKAGKDLPAGVESIFWEGACVIAGHQYLVANGKQGFIDGQADTPADLKDAQERIRYLAGIGREVISRFFGDYGR